LSLKEEGIESLIVGIFQDPDCKKTTYSGRLSGVRLSPSGLPQFCDYITGNFVLISKTIFDSVGFLDKRFTHGIADNDYGKMVLKNGFQCHTTSHYVGTCKLNGKVKWFDPSLPFKERYSRMKSPLNGNIFEYVYYIRKHDGFFQAVLVLVKSYFRLLFPRIFT
jgi:GT2 family glycosyltransferase